jgi:transcriptional regulator
MHPNPAYRSEDRALLETLINEIGFGMIFAQTPDGPRVAHTPLLHTGDGAVQFHLARGNALTRQLDGTTALAVINGPDAYVSPRWYQDQTRVPTWNYVALELEGRVRKMDDAGLLALLEGLSDRHEARIAEGTFWKIDKVPDAKLKGLLGAIVGFELEVLGWRPTLKLSQRDAPGDIAGAIAGLEAQGSHAIAALMRSLAQ